MAASPEIAERIDSFIEHVLIMTAEELPENAEDWPNMEDWQQDSWSMEWDQAVLWHLGELERRSLAGEMTRTQMERYARLLTILKEQLPVVRRLGLAEPQIDLDATLARVTTST